MINRQHVSLIEDPLSTVGNLKENYPIFVVGTAIMAILGYLLTDSLYKYKDMKRWYLPFMPLIGIIALILPYNDHMMISKILHTALGIIAAGIIIIVMWDLNRHYQPEKEMIRKYYNNLPKIAIFGTLTLFTITGISAVMEIFYLGSILSWVNIVSRSL